ncbi:MAG: Glu/Leu/Phe/Val dehydrogenase dimerization domain-containing protein [bacterium]
MKVERLKTRGYEKVFRIEDADSDLVGFVAIHSTKRGPALGGTRFWEYASEKEALQDALKLARTMSYKAAIANLACGGGKGVLIASPGANRGRMFRKYAEFVETLKGEFVTGRDAGATLDDLAEMQELTSYVVDESPDEYGNLNEATALGVFHGMRACLAHAYPDETFLNRRVVIQGVGGVGLALAKMLRWGGARLVASDLIPEKVVMAAREASAAVIHPYGLYDVQCDVFSPCALGGVINHETIPRLKCAIICGSANNQLENDEMGEAIFKQEMIYAPDYVVNAGALIQGANYYLHRKQDNRAEIIAIYSSTFEVLKAAEDEGLPANLVADRIARSRLK